ncbi:MAG TPA: DinB family protein [Terriglobales bacterium]|jgi:uncharacterized damage-inducible protein DinB
MTDNFRTGRPEPSEYAPYAEKYISLIPEQDVIAKLEQQRRDMVLLLSGRTEQDGDFRYADAKWSVKQALGHINDTERIFTYRALRIARGDKTPLAGFEQDDYVREGGFNLRSLSDLTEDFIAVRRATVSLFRNLPEAAWMRRGITNNHEFTVRALLYMTAGHELHHAKILRERYFPVSELSSK